MNYLIEDYLENWKVKRGRMKTETTINSYRVSLKYFFEFVIIDGGNPEKLTEHDVQKYFNQLEKENKSVATRMKEYTIVKTYLKYQKLEDLIKYVEFPEKDKSKAKLPKSLDKNDINKIKREIEQMNKKRDGSWKIGGKMRVALFYTMIHTGIRVFELVGLNKENVLELSERKGTLGLVGKGGQYREVPIPKELRFKLIEYLEEREDENEALFVTNRGTRMSVRNVQDLVSKVALKTSINKLHPHLFRHTYIYNAVKKLPITTVAHIAGHVDPKTTMLYTQPTIQDASDKLDDMFD